MSTQDPAPNGNGHPPTIDIDGDTQRTAVPNCEPTQERGAQQQASPSVPTPPAVDTDGGQTLHNGLGTGGGLQTQPPQAGQPTLTPDAANLPTVPGFRRTTRAGRARSERRLFHYTVFSRLVGILATREIRQGTEGGMVEPGEMTAAWFSFEPYYEPVAAKGMIDKQTGRLRTATWAEMKEKIVCRIEVEQSAAPHNCQYWREHSGISPAWASEALKGGREMGGNPAMHRCSFVPVPITKWLAVEFIPRGSDTWRTMLVADLIDLHRHFGGKSVVMPLYSGMPILDAVRGGLLEVAVPGQQFDTPLGHNTERPMRFVVLSNRSAKAMGVDSPGPLTNAVGPAPSEVRK